MSMTAGSLRDLHELHQRIGRLREQMERGPRQVEARKNHLSQRNESLEKARADLKSIKVHSHEKETERKAFDGRVNQLQLQINTAKTNKEYTTLVSEKDTATKARAVIEDQILEFLLQEEEKNQEIQITEKEVQRLRQELDELEQSTNEKSSDLAAKLAAAETQLAAAESALPPDRRDAYKRLVDRKGADSLALVSNITCMGCYQSITPQMQNQLLMSELVLCKSCGRILYLEEAPVAAQS